MRALSAMRRGPRIGSRRPRAKVKRKVCLGSRPDRNAQKREVRSDPISGHRQSGAARPKWPYTDLGREPMLGYPTEIFCNIEVAGGRVWIKPEGIKYFAGDLSEQEQKLVWATHYPPAADLLEQQKLDEVAWKSKPGWYILAQKDQTVHPDLQRLLAKRINATTVETDSSHATMSSRPDVVLEVIRKAAAAVPGNRSK
jgi:hypothetical protein